MSEPDSRKPQKRSHQKRSASPHAKLPSSARDVDAWLKELAAARPHKATTLRRLERDKKAKPARLIAYDFETTRIQPGTPRPLYLTAYALNPEFAVETPIKDFAHLLRVLETQFLTPENLGAKFVAWYGNRFDAYFVAAALLQSDKYVLRPYLTRGKTLRGLKVLPAGLDPTVRNAKGWEFVDGEAMLGLPGVKLAKLLETFAPHLPKLVDVIDFETQEFNPKNKKHRDYAMRDSMGLWVAMDRAQRILLDTFNAPLAVTMGGACIKIFQAHMPRDVEVPLPRLEVLQIVRAYVMRGGYCYCKARYKGPVWKYDLNQAYAAAMRDAALPSGFTTWSQGKPAKAARVYIARVSATHATNDVPFYYRSEVNGRMRSLFGTREIFDTWLTSIEVEQLVREGWAVLWHESYAWADSFSMREYVDKLETLRRTCEGGPKAAVGTMVKGVGNHSYGKTVEVSEPIEYVLAAGMPEGFVPFYGDDDQPFEHVFYRFVGDDEERPKAYHQPQLGAFITAHVRMVLRRVILLTPDAWLYSDTDCVVFSRDVTRMLDIDDFRYGAWKIEEQGTPYLIIAKKVYASMDGDAKKRSSKGMNVKTLSAADFERWYEGEPPEQEQTQRNNFLKVMQGAEMFRRQLRHGTAVETTTKA